MTSKIGESNSLPGQWVKEAPNLRALKSVDQIQAKIMVLAAIDVHAELFGANQWLSTGVKKELSRSLLNEFPHWAVEDVILFLQKATRGYFGQSYGHVSFAQIFEWAWKYDDEWLTSNERRHQERKEEELKPIDKEVAKHHLQKILDKWGDKKQFSEEEYRKFKLAYYKNHYENGKDIQDPGQQTGE